jgi:hypothetical protein
MATKWPAMKERGPSVTRESIVAFEERIKAKLPDDYVEFLLEVNGGQTSRNHRVFAIRLSKSATDETSLNSLNSLDDPDPQFDLASRWEFERQWLPAEVIPVGYDDGGGTVVLVVTGARRGQIWFLDGVDRRPEDANPRVEWFDRRDVAQVAGSFREFLHSLKPYEPAAT